jgi:hypothetical protein
MAMRGLYTEPEQVDQRVQAVVKLLLLVCGCRRPSRLIGIAGSSPATTAVSAAHPNTP